MDTELKQIGPTKLVSIQFEYEDHIWKISGKLAEDWNDRINAAVVDAAAFNNKQYFDDFPFDNAEIILKK
jgi:hypothetical protein